MGKLKQEYLELYLAKAAQFQFMPANVATKKGQEIAMRYLLSNRLIPFTFENVSLISGELYIDAGSLPKELEEQVLQEAKAEEGWEPDEEDEEEELKILRTYIYGVWVKEGKITGVKVVQEREIRVSTTYILSGKMRIPIEPKS